MKISNLKHNSIIKICFTTILFLLIIFPHLVSAEAEWAMPDPKIPIPGMKILKDMKPDCTEPDASGKSICTMPWLNEYIGGIYKYAIGIVAILATIVMMVGGVIWITAGGDSGRIGEAKQWITGALTGMVLVLSSYTILYFVNPDLVKLKPIKVERIVKMEPAKPASERYSSCEWIVAYSCDNSKTQSDGYCTKEKPKNPNTGQEYAAAKCCCEIKSLPGCTWKTKCGVGDNTTEATNNTDCGTNINPTNSKCCCPILGGDWTYDAGIQNQTADASLSLNMLLNCLRSNLPDGIGRISSISDSAGLTTCRDFYNSSLCAHSQNSCHYGGGTNQDGSYAVDIGDEENKTAIYQAIDSCSENIENYLFEGDHIHISSKGCRANY